MHKPETSLGRAGGIFGLFPGLEQLVNAIHLQDIFSTSLHSQDFNDSRGEYITRRIRLLSFLFAMLAPLWIPIDYFVLDTQTFSLLALLRLTFAAAFLLLGYWRSHIHNLRLARLRILLFIAIPGLFFVATHLLLDAGSHENGILVGYDFLPFLVMALLGVVPLTLLEGLFFCGLLVAIFLGTELTGSTLLTIKSLGDLWLLLLLALIAMWVQMSQLHMLLRLYREATRDALTGLVNRRVLTSKLRQELASGELPLSLLLFDLDMFKRINDTWGHITGDRVLQIFANILRHHCRDDDLVGRYGGEEFLAILPGAGLDEACEIAEEIRSACAQTSVTIPGGKQQITFTTSIGLAMQRTGEPADSLLERVDESLYQAKSAGRNIVSIAE